MKNILDTIAIEDRHMPSFFNKIPVSIERGQGIYVWDEGGKRYIDFTSGWGVTCLGHASPVICEALIEQSRRIVQNPSSGLTYSPVRARLLCLLAEILPPNLSRIFFSSSGAEANDAAIKLASKVTGRLNVIAGLKGFHGRTISTASATGQAKHREKFNPLMPNYVFVPYNDLGAMEKAMDENTAAVLLEPIQGEGGVNLPVEGYLEGVSDLCVKNKTCLIIDEVQTGFCRTGSMFAIDGLNIKIDFLTMAKGIAGGFPFGGFAVSDEVAAKFERGDHGGTYCGNPLGCAVASAVIKHLLDEGIAANATTVGAHIMQRLERLREDYPNVVREVRGKGLLIAVEIANPKTAVELHGECLKQGLFVNLTQENIIRIFPALNITAAEADQGLDILEAAMKKIAG